MNFHHFVYNFLITGMAPLVVPLMWLHQRSGRAHPLQLQQRLGFYPTTLTEVTKQRPRIWLHAASVGEVGVAAAIIRSLRQQRWPGQIMLSTTTAPGLAQAAARLSSDVICFFAPLDWWPSVNRALQMVQPDVLAIIETEIWPNLLACAKRNGVRTALINGRISSRTVHRYHRIRPLMRHTLAQVDLFSMISDTDAHRIHSLGAPWERILIHGNAKFDAVDPLTRKKEKNWARSVYGLDHDDIPVFVAGSTREPEEPLILDAFRQIRLADPKAFLIIAPRHIQRCDQIARWVTARGLSCQRRTQIDDTGLSGQKRTAAVVLLDTIGELSATYSVATFVFCGGSLVPKGGQNVLEPALWGKPVMYGPSMEDFAQARKLIETVGGGVQVTNAVQMAQVAIDWLQNPAKAGRAGQAARRAILAHRGAAAKHTQALLHLLD